MRIASYWEGHEILSQNYINGIDLPVKIFCGVDKAQPIWGELQHSLWIDPSTKIGERPKLFPKVFTWNEFFKSRITIAIGDPFLYIEASEYLKTPSKIESAVLFPSAKLHSLQIPISTENMGIECAHVEQIYEKANEIHPNFRPAICLHPAISSFSQLSQQLTKKGFKVLPEMDPWDRLLSIFSMDYVISDYPGAHVFRAAAVGKYSFILQNENFNKSLSAAETKMGSLISEFQTLENDKSRKKFIAGKILGADCMKTKSELRGILGFSGYKKNLSPLILNWIKRINRETSETSQIP
jgi:hypothetical protein